MKVFYGLEALRKPLPKTVATIGAFDGLHRAHQKILKRLIRRARRIGGNSLLITFHPHPVKVLRPKQPFAALTCIEHRLQILAGVGLDACLVLRFTKSFSRLSAEAFIRKILVEKIRIRELWVGFDYVFGRNRRGTIPLLKALGRQYGFRVKVIPEIKFGRKRYSSTAIRNFVSQGRLKEAARLLGRPYALYGKVVRGKGRGRSLGYPTANLKPLHEAVPPKGVYVVRARTFPGASSRGVLGLMNIGNRPTFERNKELVLEVHLLDFKGKLYGKKMEVHFLSRLRSERLFQSRQALIAQIRRDESAARQRFSSTFSASFSA